MKRYWITYIVGLLFAGFTFSSCLKSEEADYSQYQDCDITSFSVGDIATVRHTTTAAGKDSTYTETLTGSDIEWQIDQITGRIYNPDSLPVGTNVKKIVATISANGMLARDSASTLLYFNSGTDSLDFTEPKTFRVIPYAYSNKGDYNSVYRNYVVEVRVHKVDPDKWTWDSIPSSTASFPGAAFMEGQRAYQLDGRIYVFGTDGTTVSMASSTDGLSWTEAQPLTGMAGIDYSTILADAANKRFYGKAADGTLCVSADGITWSAAFPEADKISTLLYKENNTFYAVAGGKMVSIDATGAQTEEGVDGDEEWLPSSGIYHFELDGEVIASVKRHVFVGTGASKADTAAVAWKKDTGEAEWMYVGNTGNNIGKAACPALNHLSVFAYGKKLVAFGGDNQSEGASLKGFRDVYVSDNYGVTWLPTDGSQVFPDVFRTDEYRNLSFSSVVKGGRLWIFWSQPVNGAYIWKGNLNKVSFDRK